MTITHIGLSVVWAIVIIVQPPTAMTSFEHKILRVLSKRASEKSRYEMPIFDSRLNHIVCLIAKNYIIKILLIQLNENLKICLRNYI